MLFTVWLIRMGWPRSFASKRHAPRRSGKGSRDNVPCGVWGSAPTPAAAAATRQRANSPQGYEASVCSTLQRMRDSRRAHARPFLLRNSPITKPHHANALGVPSPCLCRKKAPSPPQRLRSRLVSKQKIAREIRCIRHVKSYNQKSTCIFGMHTKSTSFAGQGQGFRSARRAGGATFSCAGERFPPAKPALCAV